MTHHRNIHTLVHALLWSRTTYLFHSTSQSTRMDKHSNRWKAHCCNHIPCKSHRSCTPLHLQRTPVTHVLGMTHEVSNVDISWCNSCHPHRDHSMSLTVCDDVTHNVTCHSWRHMSLTGMVLGTVLSEEGVAAVAESILATPSINTSDTATVCHYKHVQGGCTDVLVDTCRWVSQMPQFITTVSICTHLSDTVWHMTTMQHAAFTKKRCQPTHLEALVCSHPQWMEAYTDTHLYHSCSHSSRC